MEDQSNLRRGTRHALTLFIGSPNGSDTHERTPFGRTSDVSISGMFLVTELRPEIGSVHTISFVWGDDDIHCTVKVIRHGEEGVGLQYIKWDTDFSQALAEILEGDPSDAALPTIDPESVALT